MKNLILIVFFIIPVYLFSQDDENRVKRIFYRDSVLAVERWYGNDKKLVSLKTYYKSGELDEDFHYKNGLFDGLSYKFNKKGEKLTSWKFERGNLIERTDHKIKFNKKNEDQVKKAHNDLIGLNEKLKQNPNDFKSTFQRANIRNYLGDNVLALNDFKKIEKNILKIQETKKIPEKMLGSIFDHLANIYQSYEMENYTIHYKLKALKASPKESRLYHNLGSYLVSIKSYRLGIEYLNKAIEMVPNHSFANWVLAVAYTDLEDYEKAMTCINIAFKNESNIYKRGEGTAETDLWTIRGFLYHKLGETEKGITDLDEALNINSDNSFALRNLGVIYYDLGDYNKSCELLQKSKLLGYEKTHDRYDLEDYLQFSCSNKTAEKSLKGVSELPFIYPNPVQTVINISNLEFKRFNYWLYNFESKLLKQGVSNNEPIDASNLPSGLYILNIESNGLIHSFKVVKD